MSPGITPIPRQTWINLIDQAMDFLKDLWGFLKVRKKFWLFPIIIILLIFGILVVFTSGTAIAPFIYTLF